MRSSGSAPPSKVQRAVSFALCKPLSLDAHRQFRCLATECTFRYSLLGTAQRQKGTTGANFWVPATDKVELNVQSAQARVDFACMLLLIQVARGQREPGAPEAAAGCALCGTLIFIPIAIIVLNIALLIWVAR